MKQAMIDRPTGPAPATTVVKTIKPAGSRRGPARWVVLAAAMITVSVVGGGIPSLDRDGGFVGAADFGSAVVGCGR